MELRYCEDCGNAIRVDEGRPESLTGRVTCEACRGGKAEAGAPLSEAEAEAKLAGLLDSTQLNLFSPQTLVIRKQRTDGQQDAAPAEKPKSTRLKLVKDGSVAAARGPAPAPVQPALPVPGNAESGSPPTGGGSTSPARSAQKIVFRCMHCRSTLSIRPVDRTSKLKCPHCAREIVITISGRVLRLSPSVAVPARPAGSAEGSVPPPAETPAPPAPSLAEQLRGTTASQGGAKPKSVRLAPVDAARVPVLSENPLTATPAPAVSQAIQRNPGSVVVVKPGSARVVKRASNRVLKAGAAPSQAVRPHNAPATRPATAAHPTTASPGGATPSPAATSAPAPGAASTATAQAPGAVRQGSFRKLESHRAPTAPRTAASPAAPQGAKAAPGAQVMGEPGTARPAASPISGGSVRMAKAVSAFEEHQARQDPDKTVFITEEATEDLSALAHVEGLVPGKHPAAAVPAAKKGSLAAQPLLADESDLLENETGAGHAADGVSQGSGPQQAGSDAASRQGIAQRVIKALF